MMSQKSPAAAPLPSGPRCELASEERQLVHPSRPSLLAGLKALGERGGEALGNAYALAARSVLRRLEQLEDSNAERRFRQRARPAASAGGSSAPGARAQQSVPPVK